MQLVGRQNCNVTHAEADAIVANYMLKPVNNGTGTLRVISDDTDIFVLIGKRRCKSSPTSMLEKWNGDVLDVNKTVARLPRRKFIQLLGIHALRGCALD